MRSESGPSQSQNLPDLIVVGAGPVGLCVALAARAAGAKVKVIAKPSRPAGWASAGMLAPAWEMALCEQADRALMRLGLLSRTLWESVAADSGIVLGHGSLAVAQDQTEASLLASRAAAMPLALAWAPPPDGVTGHVAATLPDEAVLSPRLALAALRDLALSQGIGFRAAQVAHGERGAVRLTDGAWLRAGAIVLCAGDGARTLTGPTAAPWRRALIPVHGALCALASGGSWPEHCPPVVRCGARYLIRRGGMVVVGATSRVGSDATTPNGDDIRALAASAVGLIPALRGAPVLESWAGVRPATIDARPILGWDGETGPCLALGAGRNGWLLAPAIGREVVRILAGGSTEAEFDPARFEAQV